MVEPICIFRRCGPNTAPGHQHRPAQRFGHEYRHGEHVLYPHQKQDWLREGADHAMMTIGRRYSGPRFNWRDLCDYCGIEWHRDELVLDENGFLSCPDDRDGRVDKELGFLNAQ